MKRTMMNI